MILLELIQGLREILFGMFLELGDTDVADAVREFLRFHGLNLDDAADELDCDRLLHALTHDLQRDRGLRLAAHHLHALAECQVVGEGVIDLDDDVTRADASLGGRRVVDRGHHLDAALAVLRYFNAQAAEFAFSPFLQILESFSIEVCGVRVQTGHHAG